MLADLPATDLTKPVASEPPGTSPDLPPSRCVGEGDRLVRYFETGPGRPVVLIHGAITSAEDMAIGLFPALGRDHRVVAFDRPGHGETPRRRLGGDPLDQAGRLREAMKAIGIERPVIVGHSAGGAVALSYALTWPEEVKGLVLISPLIVPELRLEHLLFGPRAQVGIGDALAYGPNRLTDAAVLPVLWDAMFKPQPMPEAFRRNFPFQLAGRASAMQATGEDAVQMIPRMAANLASAVKCEVPAVILAGLSDKVIDPLKHPAVLNAVLPNSRLHVEPGMGHMLHHFRQDLVADAVRELEQQAVPTTRSSRRKPGSNVQSGRTQAV